jgi:putative membrane protein
MKFIIRLFLTALSLLLVAYLVPGIHVDSFLTALVTALLLGILNAVVRPILVFLTLPITVLTLGLFIFVINAALFFFVASLLDGFSVDGFWYALLGSLLVSVISGIAHKLTK